MLQVPICNQNFHQCQLFQNHQVFRKKTVNFKIADTSGRSLDILSKLSGKESKQISPEKPKVTNITSSSFKKDKIVIQTQTNTMTSNQIQNSPKNVTSTPSPGIKVPVNRKIKADLKSIETLKKSR